MLKKIIFVVLVFAGVLVTADWVRAAVTGISFSNNPQTIGVGAISEKITVSSAVVVGETSDLSLTSSSATGEFSSSNTSWQPITKLTWNSTWANRSFYYRDSTGGTYTISATLATRATHQTWTASQTITIGEGGGEISSSDSGNNDDGSTSGAVNAVMENGNSDSENQSPPDNPVSASPASLKVNIGGKRLTAVNTPVSFRVKVTGVKKGQGVEHRWSFGDGATSMGVRVAHIYEYPGIYTVVLNTRRDDDEEASVQTTVEVVAPEVVISDVALDGSFIKLTNNAARPVNLGLWRLVNGGQVFILPRDTIIASRSSLILPRHMTFLPVENGRRVELLYPTGAIFAARDWPTLSPPARPNELTTILADLSGRLATRVSRPTHNAEGPKSPAIVDKPDTAPTSTIVLGEPKKLSWWQKLFQ